MLLRQQNVIITESNQIEARFRILPVCQYVNMATGIVLLLLLGSEFVPPQMVEVRIGVNADYAYLHPI